jgi:hypothetical protein
VFGAVVLGVTAYAVLRNPRWLAWRARGGTARPTPEQLADVKTADVTVVRVVGVVTALFAVGFFAATFVT